MIEPIRIRVYGAPQVFPKKTVSARGGKVLVVDTDKRSRTHPITKETTYYDHGYKRRWMDHVRKTVLAFMARTSMDQFPANHPIAMGCIFYIEKAKACKLWIPSQIPDMDNLTYAIWNALGNTRTNKTLGKYPEGVLYYDDSQIVWRLPEGEVWATEQEPPGVLISVCDALDIREEIETLSNTGELRLI